jgi:hypothetical protein
MHGFSTFRKVQENIKAKCRTTTPTPAPTLLSPNMLLPWKNGRQIFDAVKKVKEGVLTDGFSTFRKVQESIILFITIFDAVKKKLRKWL